MTSEPPHRIELPPRPTPSSFLGAGASSLTPSPSPGRADGSNTPGEGDQPTGDVPNPSMGRNSIRSLGLGHASQRGGNLTVTPANRKQSTSSTRLRNRASKSSFNSPNLGLGNRRGSRSTVGRNRDITGILSPGLDDGQGPKIPTLVPGIRPAYSTPLPVLPMVVLCIVSSSNGTLLTLGYALRIPVCKRLNAVPPTDG